jgi:Holliday junction resolvase
MSASKPPITGGTHVLPFDKLSDKEFERMCLWLVQREGFHSVEHLGAAGSEQGPDITAISKGRYWAFQLKRVQRFGPAVAEKEINKLSKKFSKGIRFHGGQEHFRLHPEDNQKELPKNEIHFLGTNRIG